MVPIKRVVDPYAKVRPLSDGTGVDTTGAKFEINPFDEIAIEEAVRLKEAGIATEVVVISIGASECEEQLRKALAIGADRAILVEVNQTTDSQGISEILKQAVQTEQPNLVLMGKQATDDDCNQAGQMLAAKLGYPIATFAAKVEISGSTATVTRETDSGEQVVQMSLPAIITTDLRLNEPRYVALPGIIKARSKPLDRMTVNAPISQVQVTSVENPPARPAGRKVASVDELAAAIKERGVL